MNTNLATPNTVKKGRSGRIFLTGLTPQQKKMLIAGGTGSAAILAGWGIHQFIGPMIAQAEISEAEVQPVAPASVAEEGCNETLLMPADIPLAQSVEEHMTFKEAFNAAREELGPGGFFEHKGCTYTTYFNEEYEAQHETQQSDFLHTVKNSISQDAEEIFALNEESDLEAYTYQEGAALTVDDLVITEPIIDGQPASPEIVLTSADFVEISDPLTETSFTDGVAPGHIPLVIAESIEPNLPLAGLPESNIPPVYDAEKQPNPWMRVNIDADHNNVIEAVGVDNDGDGFLDILAVDTDDDLRFNTYFINADGSPGMELMWEDPSQAGDPANMTAAALQEASLIHIEHDLEGQLVYTDEQLAASKPAEMNNQDFAGAAEFLE